MRRAGLGARFEAFVKLRDRLEKEGLFDAAAKRPLPALPRTVGVITSREAAALRDVLTTLKRRNPSITVVLYPVAVQGQRAAEEIAAALALAGRRDECDVLLLVRGGGSIEDLWTFNEEGIARALRACPLPVVTGIGHETDFTIADFAADRRAVCAPPRSAFLRGTQDARARSVEVLGFQRQPVAARSRQGSRTRLQHRPENRRRGGSRQRRSRPWRDGDLAFRQGRRRSARRDCRPARQTRGRVRVIRRLAIGLALVRELRAAPPRGSDHRENDYEVLA